MRMHRLAGAAALICAAAFVPAGTAAAVTTNDAAAPGSASTSSADWKDGCNFKTCIHARYTGHGWEAYADLASGISYGHIDVFGPDSIVHHSGPDQPWASTDRTVTYTGTGTGQVCAEGWYRRPDGSYEGQGFPCVTL